jgi:hypothetical protein
MNGTAEQRFYFLYGKKNPAIEFKYSRYRVWNFIEDEFEYDDFYEDDSDEEWHDSHDDEDDL